MKAVRFFFFFKRRTSYDYLFTRQIEDKIEDHDVIGERKVL